MKKSLFSALIFLVLAASSTALMCDEREIGGGPGTGNITSPNYPGNYPDNADCRYRINAGSTSRTIRLTFTAFDLEASSDCRYDYVEFSQKNNRPKYCGTNFPATQVITGQQFVYIYFITDGNVTGSGFNLQWTISGPMECDQLNLGGAPGSNGVILSPNFRGVDPIGEVDCKYRVQSSCNSNIITFRFNFFFLDSYPIKCHQWDYLEVFNSCGTTSGSIGKFCGPTLPRPLTRRSSCMSMRFITSESTNNRGYNMTYTVSGSCYPSYGVIQSPGYPMNYYNNAQNNYVIQPPNARTIRLRFTTFILEGTEPICWSDSVTIRRSWSKRNWLDRFCGTKPTPFTRTYSASRLVLMFKSDNTVVRKGFMCTYSKM